jgi:hypothetical protein
MVPLAVRNSTSYKTFVQQMLDMLINDVGGVKVETDESDDPNVVEDYVARKTVGSFLDFAGMATLHLSPVFILALISDLAYGSKTYLDELTIQLKAEGVIPEGSTIENVHELLEAIGEVSAETANVFDTPPINIAGLKNTVQETVDNIARMEPTSILPQKELEQMWADMQAVANSQDVGLFELSSAMTMYALNQAGTVGQGALTTITVSGELVDRHIIQHYWDGLERISDQGIYKIVAESSQPYIEAVWHNFSAKRETLTKDLLTGKLIGQAWDGMRTWFGQGPEE